ncbi:DUF4065 domain-containing protein [Mesorhizobium sp. M7A.T.Ca.TU.009.01.3.2]|nr:DUF4065 domain-containing protein [Mesorhizobium sp. M7A.T.Ca.TU.009.01.3.2]RUU99174.1 DUF4065 domain-containing protein [Mesorhizobium sp. M7A.T.Ca.TU.009.01.3.1]
MEFTTDKPKAVEALLLVASRMPGVTRFHASKALYFAELDHLQKYGRPIFGDRYIAMDNGPVPSFVYDVLKGEMTPKDRELAAGVLDVDTRWRTPEYHPGRKPDMSMFSQSDIESIDWAIEHVKGRSFGAISDETHKHEGWRKASLNSPIDYLDMLQGADPQIVELAEEFAAYGVL